MFCFCDTFPVWDEKRHCMDKSCSFKCIMIVGKKIFFTVFLFSETFTTAREVWQEIILFDVIGLLTFHW